MGFEAMRKKSLTISTHNISIIEKKEGKEQREEIEVETLDVDSGSENSEDEVLEDEELLEDEYSGTEEGQVDRQTDGQI